MPETIPHPRTVDCHRGHGPATRVVQWRTPDPRSATGDEHYGPFHLLVCSDDLCLYAAITTAESEGGDPIDFWDAGRYEIALLASEVA